MSMRSKIFFICRIPTYICTYFNTMSQCFAQALRCFLGWLLSRDFENNLSRFYFTYIHTYIDTYVCRFSISNVWQTDRRAFWDVRIFLQTFSAAFLIAITFPNICTFVYIHIEMRCGWCPILFYARSGTPLIFLDCGQNFAEK
jgi:hypothetical protein